jgi:16S rRNA (guanine527-N7)-methyltransferase
MPKPSRAQLEARVNELIARLGRAVPEAAVVEGLVRYVELVSVWNERVDLTGAKRADELAEVLVADALMLASRALVPEGARVVDVGSGVGAPIVPLVVLRPDVRALAIEPRRKRVAFLRTALGELDLASRFFVHEGRVELDAPVLPSIASALGAAPDIACSRATFAPSVWSALGLRLAPRVIVLGARDPLPAAPNGSSLVAHESYALPWSNAPRQIGVYARTE